jgi:hypothetical protein
MSCGFLLLIHVDLLPFIFGIAHSLLTALARQHLNIQNRQVQFIECV